MSILITKAYRLYVLIGSVRYYANRSDSSQLPYVSWHERAKEYPDHFNKYEAQMIHEFYIDQSVKIEEVVLQADEA